MAEGLLGGILGDEEEKPDVEPSETPASAAAFAAAVAARLSASDPEVARDTSTFLKRQAQLLEVQAEHLKDEHSARLHYLQGQAREVDIQARPVTPSRPPARWKPSACLTRIREYPETFRG